MEHHRRSIAAVIALMLLAVPAAACGSGSSTATRTPTVPAISTAVATSVATTPVLPGRTGIPSVDAALAAVAARDPQALVRQIQYEKIGCVTQQDIGAPPLCRAGETAGTVVEALLIAQCEGFYVRPDEVAKPMANFVGAASELYAVYRATYAIPYVAVFAARSTTSSVTSAIALYLNDSGVTGVHFGCAQTPEQFVAFNQLNNAILLPPLSGTPPSGLTGIAPVDAAITAIRNGDLDALLAQVQYTDLPCVENPHDLDPGPACVGSEQAGTVVPAFPVGNCEGGYARPGDEAGAFNELVQSDLSLYGIYDGATSELMTHARYTVLYSWSIGGIVRAEMLLLSDAGIVGEMTGCGASPHDLVSGGAYGIEVATAPE